MLKKGLSCLLLLCACTVVETDVPASYPEPTDAVATATSAIAEPTVAWPRQDLAGDPHIQAVHGSEYVTLRDNDVVLVNWETGGETQITTDGRFKYNVVLSEQFVAWLEEAGQQTVTVDGNEERVHLNHLFVYDRSSGASRQISQEATVHRGLAIDGVRLVWMDKRNELDRPYTHFDIYAYDLSLDAEIPIAVAPGVQQQPAIQGDHIVWADNRSHPGRDALPLVGCGNCVDNRFDIYLYDFATGESRPLVENEYLKANPTIDDDSVVWAEYRLVLNPLSDVKTGSADLFALDLTSGDIQQLTETSVAEGMPQLAGTRLAWRVAQDCDVIHIDESGEEITSETGIYLMDLATGAVALLTDYEEPRAWLSQDMILIQEGCMTEYETYVITLK